MLIKPFQTITFTSIELNKEDHKKANSLLNALYCANSEESNLQNKIFKIYQPYLQKEAESKPKYIIASDYLQDLYLEFFEKLQALKKRELLPKNFTQSLRLKPQTTTLNSDITTISIDTEYLKNLTLKNILTEQYLPNYSSLKETEQKKEILKKYLNETPSLTPREKLFFQAAIKRKTYAETARDNSLTHANIRRLTLNAIAKIQYNTKTLPEKYEILAIKIIDNYLPEKSISEIKEKLIKNAYIMSKEPDEIIENALKCAKELEISNQDFFKTAMNKSDLLIKNPKTLKASIINTSKLLEVSSTEYTKTAIKSPGLFIRNPESILANALKNAEFLKMDKKTFIKNALQQPILLTSTVKNLENKIKETASILNITPEEYYKYSLKHISLFNKNSKLITNNINILSKLLNLSKDEFIKLSLKQLPLLYLNPETINNNINKSANLLKIDRTTFIQSALKQPSLLYLNPDSILKNFNKVLELTGFERETYLQTALNHPVLLCQKPETIAKKVEIDKFYKMIKNEPYKFAIYTDSNKVLYNKILTFLIKEKDNLKSLNKTELVEYLKTHSDKFYKFQIPNHKLSQEFINHCQNLSLETLGKQIFKFII